MQHATYDASKEAIIPHPKEKFLIGNLSELTSGQGVQSMMKLARQYGPIYQLTLPGRRLVIVSGYELVKELSDEKRFDKKVWSALQNIRAFAGDGLFTSWTNEPNWHKAHSILMPNFGLKAMQGYLPMMVDIAEQLVGKWDRLNSDDTIDVAGDMTRLTLDTIGLCGFDYRFNSFYREDMHPFVKAMVGALQEAMERGRRLPLEDKLLLHKHHQFQADVELMNSTVDRIIRERRAENDPTSHKEDLLSHMLYGIDKTSGSGLDDENIRHQIITFLIAGHETTSGLLSFALYELMHHPDALKKAYEEVDRVLGRDLTSSPTFQQVNQLHYIGQILKESLRLWPTAPAFSVYPLQNEETIGGKYKIGQEEDVVVLIPMLHRDESIWGPDAETFDPERFSVENEPNIPADAYKPFGNGQRACIGRQFAMQEAMLVLGMLLQRYTFIDHTQYQFKIKETLTLKPDNFKIKIKKRADQPSQQLTYKETAVSVRQDETKTVAPDIQVPQHKTPLLILFGSNMGTTEDLANRIGEDGSRYGFTTTVATLDDYAGKLPQDGVVIIASASYNGNPADNAEAFCHWLRSDTLQSDSLKGVRYTLFGCGNRDWSATFQAIPRLIDNKLQAYGAKCIYPRGEGDAREDFDGQFETWYQNLWNTLFTELQIPTAFSSQNDTEPAYTLEVLDLPQGHPLAETFNAHPMRIVANHELYKSGGNPANTRSARHLEIALGEETNYKTGWHLGVIPRNNSAQVDRIMQHFHFQKDTLIMLHKNNNRKAQLPLEKPIAVYTLLKDYVELQDVATRKQIKVLMNHTECPPDKKKLQRLCQEDDEGTNYYKEQVLAKRKSLIDLLEEFPACEIPFNVYLEQLSLLRPRYYSISSSPLQHEKECSITVAVIDAPARSGHGEYTGVCSHYLSQQNEGDIINAFIQDTHSNFMLPEDPRTPLIMIGPGTGLAPFRGFLQERAVQKEQGNEIGTSLLFFGCRHPEQDFLYQDELQLFVEQGVTELYTAFSRIEGQKKNYVQDQILANGDRVWEIIEQGATIYICGDAATMAPDVRQAFANLYQDKTGKTAQDAEEWLNELNQEGRYLVDVWPA